MPPYSTTPPPNSPANGSKLPVPDIEGASAQVTEVDIPTDHGTNKWLIVTIVSVGVLIVGAIVTFITYLFISNTPAFMLNAAMQNLVGSSGEAGIVKYTSGRSETNGNFIIYTDPTNERDVSMTLSLGQDASRVSANARLLQNENYIQFAGLGNLANLTRSLNGNVSALKADDIARLGSLNGQWYSFTPDDVYDSSKIYPQHIVQGPPSSADVEKLQALYMEHPFLSAGQQLSDEKVENVNSMHLKVSVDQSKLNEFLAAVKAANIMSLQLNDNDRQLIRDSISKLGLEAWISRSDRTFQQLRFSLPGSNTLTLTLKSELAAANRQSVTRPESALNATKFLTSMHDILPALSSQSPN